MIYIVIGYCRGKKFILLITGNEGKAIKRKEAYKGDYAHIIIGELETETEYML